MDLLSEIDDENGFALFTPSHIESRQIDATHDSKFSQDLHAMAVKKRDIKKLD